MAKIRNTHELGTTAARRAVLRVAEAGLAAIDTQTVIGEYVRRTSRGTFIAGENIFEEGKLVVVAVGKCALEAARALERILGGRITAGVALDVVPGSLETMEALAGDHPFPSERNERAARRLIGVLSGLKKEDMALFTISGGASALLCLPEHTTCHDETRIMHALFAAGAPIRDINMVRKHLSLARGGRLAEHAYPARVVSLIFSDVPGDDIATIASGPTSLDTTTVADAEAVAARYRLKEICNLHDLKFVETPKDPRLFERVTNICAVSNARALDAMAEEGRRQGMHPVVLGRTLEGEAREVGAMIAAELAKAAPGTLLLAGGETTVTVAGTGIGGRNQELALGALSALAPDELILSLASDGRDNSDAAGAIADLAARREAEKKHLDPAAYLARNDSFNFWSAVASQPVTGPTGSNVSDLMIAYKGTGEI